MGLDCYWQRYDAETDVYEDIDDITFDPPLNLVSGMLSAHGQGSFRGKVYHIIILELTGHSLYTELNPKQIQEIADVLTEVSFDKYKARFGNGHSDAEIEREHNDLRRMFSTYANVEGIRLVPWF